MDPDTPIFVDSSITIENGMMTVRTVLPNGFEIETETWGPDIPASSAEMTLDDHIAMAYGPTRLCCVRFRKIATGEVFVFAIGRNEDDQLYIIEGRSSRSGLDV